jgi:mannose-6-phosphate isomerase-like protein (cupin superfamily)
VAGRWTTSRLEDVPSSAEIPVPGAPRLSAEEERDQLVARDPAAAERFANFARQWPNSTWRTHAVRRFFGIRSFGANAWEASAGDPLVIPHDETAYGQEELYLVVRGRAHFICDGESCELEAGEVLYAEPEVRREAYALETPTVVFLVGGIPGRPYEPPTWARDWGPSA